MERFAIPLHMEVAMVGLSDMWMPIVLSALFVFVMSSISSPATI